MSERNTTEASGAHPRSGGALLIFSILNGVVLLGVLLQGVSAGAFIGPVGGTGWIGAHKVVADLVVLTSLAAAIVAVTALRRRSPAITGWSIVLFALLVIQAALGYAIGEGGERTLIIAHVPLALLIMGLSVGLAIAAARSRNSAWQAHPMPARPDE